jgi:Carboxypeptidase regulatory-like domain
MILINSTPLRRSANTLGHSGFYVLIVIRKRDRKSIDRAWRLGLALSVALMAYACGGCGASSDRARVSGTLLRHDGTPLAGANVVAQATDAGKSASATTDAQGRFEIGNAAQGDGIAPGNYNVFIVEDLGDRDSRQRPTIADKYKDPAKSGISITVKPGDTQELNLTLDRP